MHTLRWLVLSAAFAPPASAQESPPRGTVYHVDPARGKIGNSGTASSPWSTLEEVAAEGKLARLKPGDTILLYTGNHGDVRLTGAHSPVVSILAAPKHTPRLARLEIDKGSGWRISGLTISPAFATQSYQGAIVTIGERGPATDITLEDCWIHTATDATAWTAKEWMAAATGITAGRHSTKLTLRNNYVQNTRFGIVLCGPDSLCEGNVVTDFSADGIRVTRDGLTVQYNVVKNAYVSEADGDANHDDGIQCFLFNKGTGTVRNAVLRGNLILGREDEGQKFPSHMQGIGFFDGPLVDFLVEQNVVLVSHWHGITLSDAQNCRILDNVAYTRWTDAKPRPWIKLGEKQDQARGNTVRGNFAHSFDFKADRSVTEENNRAVTKEIFERRLLELEAQISKKFGAFHPVSERSRVGAKKRKP
jgi:hypothetical protein